jgi:hypothetical protein
VTSIIHDVIDFGFLFVCIYGMYRGIEIGHPIYALLFTNLMFPLVCIILNLIAMPFLPFEVWLRLTMLFNVVSTLFHMTSWTVISVLRYIFIEHRSESVSVIDTQ